MSCCRSCPDTHLRDEKDPQTRACYKCLCQYCHHSLVGTKPDTGGDVGGEAKPRGRRYPATTTRGGYPEVGSTRLSFSIGKKIVDRNHDFTLKFSFPCGGGTGDDETTARQTESGLVVGSACSYPYLYSSTFLPPIFRLCQTPWWQNSPTSLSAARDAVSNASAWVFRINSARARAFRL